MKRVRNKRMSLVIVLVEGFNFICNEHAEQIEGHKLNDLLPYCALNL